MPLPTRLEHLRHLNKVAAIVQDTRYSFSRRTFLAGAGVGAILASITLSSVSLVAASGTSLLNIVAHEDDDLIFQSPDLLHAILAGNTVRTVYVTAGDAGAGEDYWSGRQSGEQAAYSLMGGVANSWIRSDAGISGHPISVYTLSGTPNVSLAFLHLPDGNVDGSGFFSNNNESLQKLWTGEISTIHAIDGSSGYSKQDLINTLASLMMTFRPCRYLPRILQANTLIEIDSRSSERRLSGPGGVTALYRR